MNKFKKLFGLLVVSSVFVACASNTPAKNSDVPQENANANEAIPAIPFKYSPTVLVCPAISGKSANSIEVIHRNPLAKTSMEVINAYLTSHGYTVKSLESQTQLDNVIQMQFDIANQDDDLSYVAGLTVGADISITYSGSIQDDAIVIDLHASEASTANLLASESVLMRNENDDPQRVLVQQAMKSAIEKLESKIRNHLIEQQEIGVPYKIVARLNKEFTDEQAEEISNTISLSIRPKFSKMQINSMTRSTLDILVYVDPSKYEDAQMVYAEFSKSLSGIAKVRKQNITKKLIIMEIQ